jgi:hypothetical protein
MEVKEFVERGDGSAKMGIDLSKAEIDFLINYAINDIFLKKLKEMEDEPT